MEIRFAERNDVLRLEKQMHVNRGNPVHCFVEENKRYGRSGFIT